jgi:hypothetical protein
MQAVWKYFRPNGGLGDAGGKGAGGMNGSANKNSLVRVLCTAADLIAARNPEPGYEIIDIGAGCGVVLAAAFAYGASSAVGMELKNEGQADVFRNFVTILGKHGVGSHCIHVEYGVDVKELTELPTVQPTGSHMPRFAFAFCEGWAEPCRRHMFALVAADVQVQVFICSGGRAKKDAFKGHKQILEALNGPAVGAPFERLPKPLKTAMFSSGETKILHIFQRMRS